MYLEVWEGDQAWLDPEAQFFSSLVSALCFFVLVSSSGTPPHRLTKWGRVRLTWSVAPTHPLLKWQKSWI